jgi:hypothetical protein
MSKYLIFRIIILILSLVPASMAFMLSWIGLFESFGIMSFMFGSASIIYAEYLYNTFKMIRELK